MENIWEGFWEKPENHNFWSKPGPEVLALIESLSPLEYKKVLDLGCGIGRYAIAFASAGFDTTATDGSARAIEYLNQWADNLHLTITTRVCDVLEDGFADNSFDVVLAYNVIYHGLREDFAAAIKHAWRILRPGGIFFFTYPSRQDGKYGFGKEIAPHTYQSSKSLNPGDIHYFPADDEIDELLAGFHIEKRWRNEGYFEHQGEKQFYSNGHVQAVKE